MPMLRIAIVTPMLPVPFDQTRGRYIHETARALGKLATIPDNTAIEAGVATTISFRPDDSARR